MNAGGSGHFGGGGRADQASTRRRNLGLIMRHLRDNGGSYRAQIAAETGLSKATASTLIADLVARGLVSEGEISARGAVGRPGLTVTLDSQGVCGIGIEVNADYLCVVVAGLSGEVIEYLTEAIEVPPDAPEEVADRMGRLLNRVLDDCRAAGRRPAGVTIAAPGVIDPRTGSVRLAPNLGWRDVPLTALVDKRLGGQLPVLIENDAKLGALAEHARVARDGVHDLLYITGDIGVGGGIISGGALLRGADGFAGEIGHMPLDPQQRQCNCGRRGCWEKAIGLPTFLELAADADDPVRDARRPLEDRLTELRGRADEGDTRTTAAIGQIAQLLGTGVSIVVDVLNPQLVVLGGYFAWFGASIVEPVTVILESRRIGQLANPVAVAISDSGLAAAARGGAHLALGSVFDDPTLVDVVEPAVGKRRAP